jgi:hypothetical protein
MLLVLAPLAAQAVPPNFGGTRALDITAPVTAAINFKSSIAGDGSGNWVAVWETSADPNVPWGNDTDIVVALSSDDGCTWSAPVNIDATALSDNRGDVRPNVATDGLGTWVTVWISQVGGSPNPYRLVSSTSTNNGVTWTAPAVVAGSNLADDEGRIGYGQGAFVVTWLSPTGQVASRSTNGGANWSSPTVISSLTSLNCCHNGSLGTDGQGGWIATWSSMLPDRDIEYARSNDNGLTWSLPAPIHPDAAIDQRADEMARVAADPAGNWVVISQSNIPQVNSNLYVIRGTGTPGTPPTTWTQPVEIDPAMVNHGDYEVDIRPDLVTNGTGDWGLVWTYQFQLSPVLPGDIDTFFSSSTNNGLTWSTPTPLKATFAIDQTYESADWARIGHAGGTWIVTWSENDAQYGATAGLDVEILTVGTRCDGLDHFLCYKAKVSKSLTVSIVDALDTGTYNVGNMQRLCTPTDKNNEGVTDANTHLTGYKLGGPHLPRSGISVIEQFGSFKVNTKTNVMLFVPANKTIPPAPPPSGPPGPPSLVDHYRCLKFKFAQGSPPFPNNITATAIDQFGSRTLRIKKPVALCIATEKNGEVVNRPNAHLMCHKVTPLPPHVVPAAQVVDQFGGDTTYVRKEKELCVPATVVFP